MSCRRGHAQPDQTFERGSVFLQLSRGRTVRHCAALQHDSLRRQFQRNICVLFDQNDGDATVRKHRLDRGRKLIDGRGPDRMVNALEVMLARPQIAGEERIAA